MDNEEEKPDKVKDIILELVGEEDDVEIDIPQVIALAERIDKSVHERKEALYVLEDVFKNAPSHMILKGVKVLETLVKNCTQKFHYDVASKDFQEAVLKLLDRKRKKKSFFKSIKQNVKNWEIIENKVLYLIQLWYDTFMMHEGEFPHIMNSYKILRKEGIKFPERNNNEVHMINFKGIKSPIFQVLEEQQMQKSGVVPKEKREELITKPGKSDYAQKFELNSQNLDKLVDNLQILGAIIDGAQQIEDFQTDFAQDIVMFLKSFKTKIMLLNSQNKLDELGDKKKQIYEFYKQTRITLKNYEERSQEVEQLNKVMQESAIEEFSKIAEKTNHVKKLKNLNIAPPSSQPQKQMSSQQQTPQSTQKQQQGNDENVNSQNIQKQQSNNADLLDLDFDQQNSNPPPPLPQFSQNYSSLVSQNLQQSLYQPQQQIVLPPQNTQQNISNSVGNNQQQQMPQMQQQQQPIQQNNNDLLDLFSDFTQQPPNQQQPESNNIQPNQNQQKQEDDGFWDEIATRK